MPEKDHKVTATFVVSGQTYTADFPPSMPMKAAVEQVLAKTKNTGQPIGNWVLTRDGGELDLSKTFAQLGLTDGVRLLLNPRTGRGG